MPVVHNRTAIDLNLRIGRSIPAHGDLEVTAEEATELADHPCLDFEPGAPSSPDKTEPESDELAAAEAELEKAQADLAAAQAHTQESN